MPFTNPVDTLTIPEGAGSGTPRIVIGQDIPQGLRDHYDTAADLGIHAAILSYSSISNAFHYRGILGAAGVPVVEGFMRTTGGGTIHTVSELVRYELSGTDHVQALFGYQGSEVDLIFGENGGGGAGKLLVQSDGGFQLAGGTPMLYASTPVGLILDSEIARMTGAVAPANAVPALVAGTNITMSHPMANCKIEAWATVDFQHAVAGADTAVVDLLIDGVVTPGQAIFTGNANTAGLRITGAQHWGPLTVGASGNHTYQLRVSKAAGVDGHIQLNSVHTSLKVQLFRED